jgi:ABC-type thiamin/hydroxymethylpyrimidine transport system permease subunit
MLLILVLVVVGVVCAAVAVFYGVARTHLLSHAGGYHRDRAIILGVIAVVALIAAAVVARMRPRIA